MKVSRTPVRDAFRILAAEDLVSINANMGGERCHADDSERHPGAVRAPRGLDGHVGALAARLRRASASRRSAG